MRFSVRQADVCAGEERRTLRKSAFCVRALTEKRTLRLKRYGKPQSATLQCDGDSLLDHRRHGQLLLPVGPEGQQTTHKGEPHVVMVPVATWPTGRTPCRRPTTLPNPVGHLRAQQPHEYPVRPASSPLAVSCQVSPGPPRQKGCRHLCTGAPRSSPHRRRRVSRRPRPPRASAGRGCPIGGGGRPSPRRGRRQKTPLALGIAELKRSLHHFERGRRDYAVGTCRVEERPLLDADNAP